MKHDSEPRSLEGAQGRFAIQLLRIFAHAERQDALYWQAPALGFVRFYAVCGDAFDDNNLEPITLATVELLTGAVTAVRQVTGGSAYDAPLLYCARARARRPRRAAYPANPRLWKLFDQVCDDPNPADRVLRPHPDERWYPMHEHGVTDATLGEPAALRHSHHVDCGGHGSHDGLPTYTHAEVSQTWRTNAPPSGGAP
jgi:hypothetical protein